MVLGGRNVAGLHLRLCRHRPAATLRHPPRRWLAPRSNANPCLHRRRPCRPAAPPTPAGSSRRRSCDKSQLPLATLAGTLAIGPAGESDARPVVLLDGLPSRDLRDDAISLTHRAVYSDREIVVGFTRCNGTIAPCGLQQPFWLELRPGLPPTSGGQRDCGLAPAPEPDGLRRPTACKSTSACGTANVEVPR